jgi:hydroxyacylglutathione hydrolase
MANETDAIILDVRHQKDFIKGHIPRSIFIGIDGGFAPWVGALIGDVKQAILLVAPEGREEETITRLSRVGFDNTVGYLKGSFKAWKNEEKETDSMKSISAEEFETLLNDETHVVDVRKDGEYASAHINNAQHISLDFINEHIDELPENEPFYVHCAGGYRSVIAASILKSRGIHNLVDIAGGFGAIEKVGIPVTDFVCPSTLK